jgi:cytochrome c oxidase cbb3-type subunit 4
MKSNGLKYFTDLFLTEVGLLIFVLVFISVIVWLFRKGSNQYYENIAQLPLDLNEENLKAESPKK